MGADTDVTVDTALAEALMAVAIDEARAAPAHGDVPIGAVIARLGDGEIVARRHNERERRQDPTAHAEILALADAAGASGSWRLSEHVLVVTLEPCAMCAGALVNSRIGEVVYGAADPKAGALGSRYHLLADPRLNHECPVRIGIRAEESATLLRDFFASRRTF